MTHLNRARCDTVQIGSDTVSLTLWSNVEKIEKIRKTHIGAHVTYAMSEVHGKM